MFDKMDGPVENVSDSNSSESNSGKTRVSCGYRRSSLASNRSNINESFASARVRNVDVNVDTTALICLLQSVGFQLKRFDKVSSVNERKKSNYNNELVRVTIECEVSGMRADLEYRNPQCTCPKEDAKASLWNVSGSGAFFTGSSSNIHNLAADDKFIESGSNLLPSLNKEAVLQLGDTMALLIYWVNTRGKNARQDGEREEDGGQAAETSLGLQSNFDGSFQDLSWSTGITRCYTQPEFCISDEMKDRRLSLNPFVPRVLKTQPSEEKSAPALMRQSTFEFKDAIGEPRKSPPKILSSPVTVCSSLGQLSLPSDEEDPGNHNIGKCLEKASFYLERARRLYSTKKINDECSSIEFNNSPRDDVFLRPRDSSRSSSLSSKSKSPPVTVRKKNQSVSQSPAVRKTLTKLETRRTLSSSSTTSSLRRPNSVSLVGTGGSPVTLGYATQSTTPNLPPRTRSVGTPSPTQRQAPEIGQKKTSQVTFSRLAAPGARTLPKPSTTGARIVVPVLGRAARAAYQSATASTTVGANEERKSYLPSYSQGIRKKNSMGLIETDLLKNSNPPPVRDGGKKNLSYSATFGLKK